MFVKLRTFSVPCDFVRSLISCNCNLCRPSDLSDILSIYLIQQCNIVIDKKIKPEMLFWNALNECRAYNYIHILNYWPLLCIYLFQS